MVAHTLPMVSVVLGALFSQFSVALLHLSPLVLCVLGTAAVEPYCADFPTWLTLLLLF
jgi:hypothetical protein